MFMCVLEPEAGGILALVRGEQGVVALGALDGVLGIIVSTMRTLHGGAFRVFWGACGCSVVADRGPIVARILWGSICSYLLYRKRGVIQAGDLDLDRKMAWRSRF